MNERIKEIAKQAGFDPNMFEKLGVLPYADNFVGLIVKEHLNILQQEWYRLNNISKDDLDTPRDIGIRVGQKSEIIRLIHLIQQHFGLESVHKPAHETNTDNPIDFPRE